MTLNKDVADQAFYELVDYKEVPLRRFFAKALRKLSRMKVIHNRLDCNKKCIEFLKPGVTWDEYNKYANSLLIEGLKKIGLIKTDQELVKYYWHSIGHSTGLDTHDPDIRNVLFEEGMVMTVEPGLYLEDEGIGVRIEDTILITKYGYDSLTNSSRNFIVVDKV